MKSIMFISNGDKSKKQDINNIKMESFYKPCIEALDSKKYKIFAGINCDDINDIYEKDGIYYFNQNIYRSIFAFKDNWKAYRNINKIIKNNDIDIIHCNTPIGGFLGRICGHKNKVKKIIYTAHGFHFFKGNNPIKNFIFRNIEKYLARYTDAIITMNNEDYENAQNFKLNKSGKVYFTHGIGIDIQKYRNKSLNVVEKRKEIGLKKDDLIIISAGDLVKNKNYIFALDIVKALNNKKIKYLICGNGSEQKHIIDRIQKLDIKHNVKLLGYRTDIADLYRISDIFLFTSKREGLPRTLIEAISSGLPCVVSNIRGNRDIIKNIEGSYCCSTINEYTNAVQTVINNIRDNHRRRDATNINKYSYDNVANELKLIYKEIGL